MTAVTNITMTATAAVSMNMNMTTTATADIIIKILKRTLSGVLFYCTFLLLAKFKYCSYLGIVSYTVVCYNQYVR